MLCHGQQEKTGSILRLAGGQRPSPRKEEHHVMSARSTPAEQPAQRKETRDAS